VALDVKVTGADQLYALNRRFKEAGRKDLPRKLRAGIRDGVKPAVVATKAAVLTIPIRGTRGGGRSARAEHAFERSRAKDEDKRRIRAERGSGLRQTISRAIKVQIKTGKTASVRIVVDEKQLPADQRSLPRHLDSDRGWRKPTFGHEPWTQQYGKPYFEVTIRKHLPEVRAAVLKALDDVAKQIEG
jgi:hypothetical protein